MYSTFSLFVLGGALLYGQASSPGLPQSRLSQAKDALAAARDAELLEAPVSLADLTEDRALQLEQAALRQLERAKAHVEQVQTMVDAGLEPKQSLVAPQEEQAFAQNLYDLTLSRA